MISRRQLLVRSTGGLAAAGIGWPALAAGGTGTAPALFLYDSSVPGAAEAAARAGVPVAGFRGDVGVPWLEVIEPLWRNGGVPIAGVTDGGALFCLEQLGRSYGMACTVRLDAGEADAILHERVRPARRGARGQITDAPVAWLLQPRTNR